MSALTVSRIQGQGGSFQAAKASGIRLANVGFSSNYDVAPDGKRIAALLPAAGPEAQKA